MEGVIIEGENMEGVISLGVIAGEYTTVGAGTGARVAPSTAGENAIRVAKTHANKVVDRGRFRETVLISIRLTFSCIQCVLSLAIVKSVLNA